MLISIRVQPRSKRNALEWGQSMLKARLTAPPIDGAANEALIELLAERLDLPKRSINIVRGATSRQKVIEIEGMSLQDVEEKLK